MTRRYFWVLFTLIVLLAGLQYRLWIGDGSLAHLAELKQKIAKQEAVNDKLYERNKTLGAEVIELKEGMETVEELARRELGMVKKNEMLYQLAQ